MVLKRIGNTSSLVNGIIEVEFKLEKLGKFYAANEVIQLKPNLQKQLDHSYYGYIFKAKK